ncbi:ParB/RepB/Spo0J family partition protein [Jannaschia aquimarina]|uniref:ParB_1 protein n=1 Tax=Jannaschia aquimarina TaxID=935700 RepID=A0A0D1EDG1_9RHOB|nr:ParB/RepB/Spo0J family partition protein [Jannaschia aquimarina]KIT14971.1 Chromosome-partitioning protein ParB [Jannaschia aquimarina]SNS60804.1 chromosome segregation DNA-binding protein [Jannaschia aquimarina]
MSDPQKRRGLGRGLSALMADLEDPGGSSDTGTQRTLPIEALEPNPDQPRRRFDDDALHDLAASIREKGLLQPIIVRPHPNQTDRYQVVAGERRWRASQLAQIHEVPVIVRDLDDQSVLEIAIIENVQRVDLNPIEEALGFKQLIDRFGHTQEQLAKALGKSRSHIANQMRLLNLPEPVLEYLKAGVLSAGHARAMLTADDPVALARQTVAAGLSVREVERRAKGTASSDAKPRKAQTQKGNADTRMLADDLSAAIGMAVVIDHENDGSGRLTIKYKDLTQLDQICEMLSGFGTERTAR